MSSDGAENGVEPELNSSVAGFDVSYRGINPTIRETLIAIIHGTVYIPAKLFKYGGMILRLRNPFDILRFLNRLRPVEVNLRNGSKVTASTLADMLWILDKPEEGRRVSLSLPGDKKKLSLDLFGVGYDYGFSGDRWTRVKPMGKVIIDVGASVGDSAFYFLSRGAKEIYAIEPSLILYRHLESNIRNNGLTDIYAINCQLAGSNASIDGGLTQQGRINAKSCSLSDFAKVSNSNGLVLKMSCEGCEHVAISTIPNDELTKFEQIFIEFFYCYRDIKRRLALLYDVRVYGLTYDFTRRRIRGFLYATRKS